MTTEFIAVISAVALLIISASAYFDGLDFRKWSSWLYGIISVLLLVLNFGISVKSVVIAVSLVALIWIIFIASIEGFDLKKRTSWIYGIAGFLCGVASGTAIRGVLIESLKMGIIFAFVILSTGAVMRRHKLKYGKK